MTKDKFHSFDALRFLSFLIVFTSHLPFDIFSNSNFIFLKDIGHVGVYFFFTLSGFLITYILLNEKKNAQQISLKNFFIRRILRIWPLFYLMILFAYLSPHIITFLGITYSNEGYQPNYFLTCLFLENYHTIYSNQFPNVMPLPVFWSLCVEEHFYIIWGLILYYTSIKKVPFLILLFLILPVISRYFFIQNELKTIDLSTTIDLFMYGAIPAYLYVNHKEKLIKIIEAKSNYLKASILITTIIVVLSSASFEYKNLKFLEPTLLGILFCLTLSIFLPSKNIFKITDKNIISKLGVFTYSLYLTHILIISFLRKITFKWNLNFDQNELVFFSISLILTIVISYFSYNFIEKPFLQLKKIFNQN